MQRDVVTLDASSSADVAERLMRADRIRHLAIVSEGRLVGVLTQRDVLRAGAGPDTLARTPIRDLMAAEALTARPDSTLQSAVEMMLLRDVGCLPVLEGERLVGMITRTDCLRHLVEILAEREGRRA